MKRNTRQRTRNGLIAAAAIFVVIGVGVVLGSQRLITNASWVTHSNEVIVRLDELEARLRDAEAAQRGYLLTANPIFLADYRNASATLPGIYEDLRGRLVDAPAQLARVQALWARVQQRQQQLERTLQRYREGGLAAAQAAIDRNAIESSTAIRQQAEGMRVTEGKLLAQRAESTHDSAILLRVLALLGIPIGILVILVVYRMLVQEIRRRARAEDEAAKANAQLRIGIGQVERGSADLHALSQYGSMLQSCATPEEALRLTRNLLVSVLPEASGGLYSIRNSKDHAELDAQWGALPQAAPAMPVDACWALRRGQPHFTAFAHAPRCEHVDAGLDEQAATLCLPLAAYGVQVGLLTLSGPEQALADRRDIFEAVAEKLSMALGNLSMQERLRHQSIRDPLTGLFNRRYLEVSAAREIARCARRDLPLSLLMLDIDHFKAFNDLHGHPGGDALLAQFGKLLQAMTRGEDIACRYGGEEFTLILPEADLDAACQRAETIRIAVQAMQVAYLGKLLPQVTVSIGVASFPLHGNVPEALIHTADEALYRAKRNGRNRIEVAIEP